MGAKVRLFYEICIVCALYSAVVTGGASTEELNCAGNTTALQLKTSNAVMFVVPAGTGKVEVQFLSGNGYNRSLKYQIGSNSALTAGTTSSKGITMSFGYSVTKETQIKLMSDNDNRTYAYSVSVKLNQETISLNATYGYATYSCVNDINIDAITASTGTVTVYKATSSDASKVTLESVTGKVPAGTGLVLKGTPGATITIPYTTGASALEGSNLLKAVNQSGSLSTSADPSGTTTTGTNYVLTAQSGNVVFAAIGDSKDATMKAGQAYLNVPGAGAPALSISFEGETTGIASTHRESNDDDVFYNLNGQRISNPVKGLYIKNGKKIIMK